MEKCLLRARFDFWPRHGEGLVDVPGGQAPSVFKFNFHYSAFLIFPSALWEKFTCSSPLTLHTNVKQKHFHLRASDWPLARRSLREDAAERDWCLRRGDAALPVRAVVGMQEDGSHPAAIRPLRMDGEWNEAFCFCPLFLFFFPPL